MPSVHATCEGGGSSGRIAGGDDAALGHGHAAIDGAALGSLGASAAGAAPVGSSAAGAAVSVMAQSQDVGVVQRRDLKKGVAHGKSIGESQYPAPPWSQQSVGLVQTVGPVPSDGPIQSSLQVPPSPAPGSPGPLSPIRGQSPRGMASLLSSPALVRRAAPQPHAMGGVVGAQAQPQSPGRDRGRRRAGSRGSHQGQPEVAAVCQAGGHASSGVPPGGAHRGAAGPQPAAAHQANDVPPVPGWDAIDAVGLDMCLSIGDGGCTHEVIPAQHREAFFGALRDVVHQVNRAADDHAAQERGLKWLLVLPQVLLRKPRWGGGQGRHQVEARFNQWEGAKGSLLRDWLSDRAACVAKQVRQRGRAAVQTPQERKVTAAMRAISMGQISRAARVLDSNGVADASDPDVRAQLLRKHPRRKEPVQAPEASNGHVAAGFSGKTERQRVKAVANLFKQLQPLVNPGPFGMRNEYLRELALGWGSLTAVEQSEGTGGNPVAREALFELSAFMDSYLQGRLPEWFYGAWGSLSLTALVKPKPPDAAPNALPAVRPIGMGDSLRKAFHLHAFKENKTAMAEYLEPLNVVLAEGGAAKLVHSVRMMHEANPSFVVLHLDTANAFNELKRSAIIKRFGSIPKLKHMQRFLHATLNPSGALVVDGEVWTEPDGVVTSDEGVTQGDPLSAAVYAVTYHEALQQLDADCAEDGGAARAGADDVYALATVEGALNGTKAYMKTLRVEYGLKVHPGGPGKTEIYCPTLEAIAAVERWVAAQSPDDPDYLSPAIVKGVHCYGVPMGEVSFVEDALSAKAAEVEARINNAVDTLLPESRQAAWQMLRCSGAMQLDYWLQLSYPSQILGPAQAAERVDEALWAGMERCFGFEVDKEDPVLVARVRQPIKLKGLGLRSHVESMPMAFLGGVDQAVPQFAASDRDGQVVGRMPQLQHVVGVDSFAEGRTVDQWRAILEAANTQAAAQPASPHLGHELSVAHHRFVDATLQARERSCGSRAHQRLPGDAFVPRENDPSQAPTASFSNGDGTVRQRMQAELERVRAARLEYDTSEQCMWYLNHKAMAVRYCDPHFSSQWVTALPLHPAYEIPNGEFSEVAARFLGVPSPACKSHVGHSIAGLKYLKRARDSRGRVWPKGTPHTMDEHGDALASVTIEGNFEQRHDVVKRAIDNVAHYCGVRVNTEVYGLFAGDIPQPAAAAIEANRRKRQGLVPDFELVGWCRALAELKLFGCCASHYIDDAKVLHMPAAASRRGLTVGDRRVPVMERARSVPGEYEKNLRDIDAPDGRLLQRLRSYGQVRALAVGAFGEVSKDLAVLVHELVARKLGASPESQQASASVVYTRVRRTIGVAVVRAHAQLLLQGLVYCGPGGAERLKAKRQRKEEDRAAQDALWADYRATFHRSQVNLSGRHVAWRDGHMPVC